MQAPTGQIVVNPTFNDWEYEDGKPIRATSMNPITGLVTYHVAERMGAAGTMNDPRKPSDLDAGIDQTKARRDRGQNRALLTLLSFVCLMSISALALSILILFGKIGHGYECSTNGGQ